MDLQRKKDFVLFKKSLHLLISVTNLLYRNTPNVFLVYLKSLFKSWITTKMTDSLKCVPVPGDVFERLIPETFSKCHSVDHCMLLNKEHIKDLQVSSRKTFFLPVTYVSHSKEQSHEISTPQHVIEVIPTKDLPRKQVLMSETMYYNLKNSLKISHINDIILKIKKANEPMVVELQYASKVVVALIQTPQEVHQDLVKDCLSTYFEKARLLSLGDIFSINVSSYVPEAHYTSGLESMNHLYFKVQELEGPPYDDISYTSETLGYLVAKNETTLLQNNCQSFIPSSMFFYNKDQRGLLLSGFKDKFLPHCPPSLNEVQDTLVQSLEPFLNKSKSSRPPSIKPVFWIIGPPGCGKQSLLISLAARFGIHLWNFNCDEVFGKVSGQIEGKLKALFAKARTITPCILVLSDIQLLCKNSEGQEDLRIISLFNDLIMEDADTDFPLIVVATSNTEASVLPSMARIFLQTFVVPNLDETGRKTQLRWFVRLRGANISYDCLTLVSGRCSGFLYSDLEALVGHAVRNSSKREKTILNKHLTWEDFEEALDQMQSAYSDAIGAPKIPSVSWADVGGLTAVKDEILRTVNTPLLHPELVASGLRRSGVLLYGPPGTGKTLIAKAVATECSLNFLSVKGPELLNMYVGQSEENVREVFERARAAAPCIIFFDELDSLAPNRGKSGDSGGVMDRVVSQLLAEMDGLQKSTHLFVIGATNRPDLIDPALLRPGRFDKLLYVSACEDHESIACVMRALTRKFKLGEDVDIEDLTKRIPTQVTGADIYAVCSNAWRNAVRRAVKDLTLGMSSQVLKQGLRIKDSNVEVNEEDFLVAISEMNPSVSSEDMKYFKNLQQELSGNKNYVFDN